MCVTRDDIIYSDPPERPPTPPHPSNKAQRADGSTRPTANAPDIANNTHNALQELTNTQDLAELDPTKCPLVSTGGRELRESAKYVHIYLIHYSAAPLTLPWADHYAALIG